MNSLWIGFICCGIILVIVVVIGWVCRKEWYHTGKTYLQIALLIGLFLSFFGLLCCGFISGDTRTALQNIALGTTVWVNIVLFFSFWYAASNWQILKDMGTFLSTKEYNHKKKLKMLSKSRSLGSLPNL